MQGAAKDKLWIVQVLASGGRVRRNALMPLRRVTGIVFDDVKLALAGSGKALLMVTPFSLTPTFGESEPVDVKRS